MKVLTPERTRKSQPPSFPKTPIPKSPKPFFNFKWFFLVLIVLGMTIAFVHGLGDEPFIIQQPDGTYVLADWRLEKMAKEMERIYRKPRASRAEQYVLVAEEDGWYPCYSCPNSAVIFLKEEEIWKYGKTIHNKETRYPGNYLELNRLDYIVEYVGTEIECLVLEKRKIYNYAIHPENLARPFQLIRPPGNKIDR